MRRIIIPGIDIPAACVGFGTASIMGSVGKKRSIEALSYAYERGVNYLDLARSYGFGEAEKVVGEFVSNKRDSVIIATKFGIFPTKVPKIISLAKPIIRIAQKRSKFIKNMVRKQSSEVLNKGFYSVHDAKKSLEKSLTEIGTDYIDVLHIHDCISTDQLTDELLCFLEKCIKEGKIRTWGIASDIYSINSISSNLRLSPPVIQYQSNAFLPVIPESKVLNSFRIVHSPFGGATCKQRLSEVEDEVRVKLESWCSENIESNPPAIDIYKMLLLSSSFLSDKGLVITSMFDLKHIEFNIQTMTEKKYPVELIEKFIDILSGSKEVPNAAVGNVIEK